MATREGDATWWSRHRGARPRTMDTERPHREGLEGIGERDLYGAGGWTTERGVTSVDVTGASHIGRGPRGYVRSDARIYEDVCEAIAGHGEIDARDVEVSVKDREVTLRGTVPDRWTKRRVEAICDGITGVEDVHNQLQWTGDAR